jgi:hypothetical protein
VSLRVADAEARLVPRIRTWAIRVGVLCLVVEVLYVAAANLFIRTDFFERLINRRPEKNHLSWDSAVTYFPGVASVRSFTLRGQTRKDQIYLHVAGASARISLLKLMTKTVHIRGVDARDVDFRYRERVDSPRRTEGSEPPHELPPGFEFYPEIPGFGNPPDPKPEELYPRKNKVSPWTFRITGAHVEGPIRVALNEIRISGEGWAGGGVTVKPKRSITIHRGILELAPATLVFGPEVVTNDLDFGAEIRIDTFPARGAKLPEIVGGLSGTVTVAGRLSDAAAVGGQITPGLTALGAGAIDGRIELVDGVLQAGSELSLLSDAFHTGIMGLDATGSATVSLDTARADGAHLTSVQIAFGEFQFVDPEDASVQVAGSGLSMDAEWNGFSLAGKVPASRVEVVVPPTRINDVRAFSSLIPPHSTLSIESGTGELEARLEVDEARIAKGRLDLVADDIVLKSHETPFFADLEVHTILAEGDLHARRFDLSGTTIRLDDIVDSELPVKKQQKLEPWFCDLELERGIVTFGRPITTNGHLDVKMHDTRPVVALLRDFTGKLKWLSLMPNVKGVDGSMNLSFDADRLAVEQLALSGENLEVLGWVHIRGKKPTGRIFAKHAAIAAGMALDEGKRRVILAKPRSWFEEQRTPPPRSVQLDETSP